MDELPRAVAYVHSGVRTGFEVVFLLAGDGGLTLEGRSTGVEDGEPWSVSYVVVVDERWRTREAVVTGRTSEGGHERRLAADGAGHWHVDGRPAPQLGGCLDVDLEASGFTNALPVNRLRLATGQESDAPAAWVRTRGLEVESLDQRYQRVEDEGPLERYDYSAPALDFRTRLTYDRTGLPVSYPPLSERVL